MKAKEWALCFVLDFPMGQCFEEDASSLCQRNTKCRGTEVWLVRALGPRRSLARLLDVLGPRGGVPVYGGMGLLVGHLGGCWGEVLVTPGDDSGDEHGRLGWTGAFPLLVILVLLFFGVSRMRVFLHNSHPTSFHGGRMSSFRLQLPLGRRRHEIGRAHV